MSYKIINPFDEHTIMLDEDQLNFYLKKFNDKNLESSLIIPPIDGWEKFKESKFELLLLGSEKKYAIFCEIYNALSLKEFGYDAVQLLLSLKLIVPIAKNDAVFRKK